MTRIYIDKPFLCCTYSGKAKELYLWPKQMEATFPKGHHNSPYRLQDAVEKWLLDHDIKFEWSYGLVDGTTRFWIDLLDERDVEPFKRRWINEWSKSYL